MIITYWKWVVLLHRFSTRSTQTLHSSPHSQFNTSTFLRLFLFRCLLADIQTHSNSDASETNLGLVSCPCRLEPTGIESTTFWLVLAAHLPPISHWVIRFEFKSVLKSELCAYLSGETISSLSWLSLFLSCWNTKEGKHKLKQRTADLFCGCPTSRQPGLTSYCINTEAAVNQLLGIHIKQRLPEN